MTSHASVPRFFYSENQAPETEFLSGEQQFCHKQPCPRSKIAIRLTFPDPCIRIFSTIQHRIHSLPIDASKLHQTNNLIAHKQLKLYTKPLPTTKKEKKQSKRPYKIIYHKYTPIPAIPDQLSKNHESH